MKPDLGRKLCLSECNREGRKEDIPSSDSITKQLTMLLYKEVYFPIKIFTTTAALPLIEDTVVFSLRKCTIQPNKKKKSILISPMLGEREIYKKYYFLQKAFLLHMVICY